MIFNDDTNTSNDSDIKPLMPKGDMLSGMRVLDLSRALSGPFCTMTLGDLGADIWKVEPAGEGDLARSWGPFDRGQSVYYLSTNRNKRGICIDFRNPEAVNVLREIALSCDVIVENFKPGTLEKMGFDLEGLRAVKPSLIIASISGFGSSGPISDRAGLDQIAQGQSGFMSFTGTEETGSTRVGVAIGDLTSGMWLVIGILAAWCERIQTGKGRIIETSLFAGLVGLLSVQGQRYLSLGQVAKPSGNSHPIISPYGVFRASDGDLNIGAATQKMWLKFCDLIGSPELKSDPRFKDNASRYENRSVLKSLIDHRMGMRTREQWTNLLVDAGIPAGPINSMSDVFADPQLAHLALITQVEHIELGKIDQVLTPIHSNGMPVVGGRKAPPTLGQHTRELLREAGLSVDKIDHLIKEKVVFENSFGK